MIEVFARRANSEVAGHLVRKLRAEGRAARENNPRYFEPDQIDSQTVLVYHDGTDPLVPWAYQQCGIECELIPGLGESRHGATDSYHLEKSGQWFKLIGPDGQVGKSKRTEADAWAQLEGAG